MGSRFVPWLIKHIELCVWVRFLFFVLLRVSNGFACKMKWARCFFSSTLTSSGTKFCVQFYFLKEKKGSKITMLLNLILVRRIDSRQSTNSQSFWLNTAQLHAAKKNTTKKRSKCVLDCFPSLSPCWVYFILVSFICANFFFNYYTVF